MSFLWPDPRCAVCGTEYDIVAGHSCGEMVGRTSTKAANAMRRRAWDVMMERTFHLKAFIDWLNRQAFTEWLYRRMTRA